MNHQAHRNIGIGTSLLGAGVTIAVRRQRLAEANQPGTWLELLSALSRAFGAALGGAFGAALPDLIEPAVSPNHRKGFHSALVALPAATSSSAATYAAIGLLEPQLDSARAQIDAKCARGDFMGALIDTVKLLLVEAMLGAAPALPVGYTTHLLADATTPKGLPWLT